MFHLESALDGPPFQPEYVYLLDRAQRRVVVVEWQPLQQRWMIAAPLTENGGPVGSRDPYLHSHTGTDFGKVSLDLRRLSGFRGRALSNRSEICVVGNADCDVLIDPADSVCNQLSELVLVDRICLSPFVLGSDYTLEKGPVHFAHLNQALSNLTCPCRCVLVLTNSERE